MPYAEFPADEIIDCHFKKPDDPGDPFPPGTHLCGELNFDLPGVGWSVIYHDPPTPTTPGPTITARGPQIVVPRSGLAPAPTTVAWETGDHIYLMPHGIFFNPYGYSSFDEAQHRPSLMVPAVAYVIGGFEGTSYPGPPPTGGTIPCVILIAADSGLGMTNAVIDPNFNIFRPNQPIVPNYGPGLYDVANDGSGILFPMSYVELINQCGDPAWVQANCAQGGCYMNYWLGESHWSIKALCTGPDLPAPGSRTRIARARPSFNPARASLNG